MWKWQWKTFPLSLSRCDVKRKEQWGKNQVSHGDVNVCYKNEWDLMTLGIFCVCHHLLINLFENYWDRAGVENLFQGPTTTATQHWKFFIILLTTQKLYL